MIDLVLTSSERKFPRIFRTMPRIDIRYIDSTGSKREQNNSFSSFRSLRIRFPREKVSTRVETSKNSCSTTCLRGGGKMRNNFEIHIRFKLSYHFRQQIFQTIFTQFFKVLGFSDSFFTFCKIIWTIHL